MGMLSDDTETGGRSSIISMAELLTREGAELGKGMNYRDDPALLSVFLILPREGEYTDSWDADRALLICEGHDSVAEGAAGRKDDQLLMYASGRPTENGKFYKAAHAYKDGMRDFPLQVQVYEKLDPGVFFDKGIFNLVDATYGGDGTRKVARFFLSPADAADHDPSWSERMIPASLKAQAWVISRGRCGICASEEGLHFVSGAPYPALLCTLHLRGLPGSA